MLQKFSLNNYNIRSCAVQNRTKFPEDLSSFDSHLVAALGIQWAHAVSIRLVLESRSGIIELYFGCNIFEVYAAGSYAKLCFVGVISYAFVYITLSGNEFSLNAFAYLFHHSFISSYVLSLIRLMIYCKLCRFYYRSRSSFSSDFYFLVLFQYLHPCTNSLE